VATGNALIAAGRLTDHPAPCRGLRLTLAPLDLRQESARHTQAVAWIAAH
jgi:phosphoenolpyruvate carboxylase